jgi:hypothetical protein
MAGLCPWRLLLYALGRSRGRRTGHFSVIASGAGDGSRRHCRCRCNASRAGHVADENVRADQLPEDGWTKLARELLERGEFRLAMRAFYLASLARISPHAKFNSASHVSNPTVITSANCAVAHIRFRICYRSSTTTFLPSSGSGTACTKPTVTCVNQFAVEHRENKNRRVKKHFPSRNSLLGCAAAFSPSASCELFELRFERGDVYPAYSSLRADPLGAMAFYESLEKIPGLSAAP